MRRDICWSNWKQEIPIPVYEKNENYVSLYWKAWELALLHIKEIPGMPQTPYMDEAFSMRYIWIWDTCFMALFCKYSPTLFPGVESLQNFYEVFYDGKVLPDIIPDDNLGESPKGIPTPLQIHIFDNPPLFAWAEYHNILHTGNMERLKMLLDKQYLQKHYEYLENLTEQKNIDQVMAPTFWRKQELGYFWEGGSSGMDNTPRGRTESPCTVDRPNNPNMLWIDAIAQQGLSALCISRLAKLAGDDALSSEWKIKYLEKKRIVNTYYYDEKDEFYYDIDFRNGDFMKVKTLASFWVLESEMASADQAEAMCRTLLDPKLFGGKVPCVSLARNDGDFAADGGYWRGALWLPTAYMTIKSLEKYGKYDLATELSCRIVEHMSRTYFEYSPHTIWECYAPNVPEPSYSCDEDNRRVRPDFCGWSAVGPICLFLENVIGIHSVNAVTKSVRWNIPSGTEGKIGIRNFCIGEIRTDLLYDSGRCMITSDGEYNLYVNDYLYHIYDGENIFSITKIETAKEIYER